MAPGFFFFGENDVLCRAVMPVDARLHSVSIAFPQAGDCPVLLCVSAFHCIVAQAAKDTFYTSLKRGLLAGLGVVRVGSSLAFVG